MTNLKSHFHKVKMRRLNFPHSVRFPSVFEEFQNIHFFSREIISRIHKFVKNVDEKIINFCKEKAIAAYTQPFVVERDVQVEFGVWVPSAGACIEIYALPEDIEKIYVALPEILKDHKATKETKRFIDQTLEETIGEAPDNIWQILFHEKFEDPGAHPIPASHPAPFSPQ